MDFISWVLAIIGIGSDRAMHRNDKRAEVARLNAEVAGEVGRTLDILSLATPRLKRLASQIAADHPEIHLSIVKFLDDQQSIALTMLKQTEDNKDKIATAKGFPDWDKAVRDFQEWGVTASRIPPWVQDVVDRYDAVFLENGIR
ncbi:hypothetical protein GOZ94_11510 [Agrobacterium vitis]|uniref:hypothetical protein n=1 Tax=Agrobacterium vitis TaxID=373 RepID=UPI0012E87CF4|nr:hypothetical protein [Agrobacterium vitis]MVA19575.1 hypothetical protein [Agrobacterium vitis]